MTNYDRLRLIVKNEYLTDVRAKSFWISAIVVPIVMVLFGIFIGFMMDGADSTKSVVDDLPISPDDETMTPMKALGLMMGMLLTMFLMMYGAGIFNKVKNEKCNRIVEIIATCVDGRTMMLAKIIAVGLTGMTMILLWALLGGVVAFVIAVVFPFDMPLHYLADSRLWATLAWMVAYFIGGYIFFGSLYAASGALTDKDNENQIYMSVLTFALLAAFYIGMYAVDNGDTPFARVCEFIPFTSPTIGCVNAVTGAVPVWESVISVVVLYISAAFALAIAGKIYTCSLLLKGKSFTPRDILIFLKSK